LIPGWLLIQTISPPVPTSVVEVTTRLGTSLRTRPRFTRRVAARRRSSETDAVPGAASPTPASE